MSKDIVEYARGESEKEVRQGTVVPCHGLLGCLLNARIMLGSRLWAVDMIALVELLSNMYRTLGLIPSILQVGVLVHTCNSST